MNKKKKYCGDDGDDRKQGSITRNSLKFILFRSLRRAVRCALVDYYTNEANEISTQNCEFSSEFRVGTTWLDNAIAQHTRDRHTKWK